MIKIVLRTPYPLSSVLSYKHLTEKHLNYTLVISFNIEPQSFEQACRHTKWVADMNKEIRDLQENHTCYVTDLPSGNTPIGYKCVYKIKHKADGTIERHKARLVAKGYT